MSKLWRYEKRNNKLLINFSNRSYICNGPFSYLQIDPSISEMYMKKTYKQLKTIISLYNPNNCLVIVNSNNWATELVESDMEIVIAKLQYKGVKLENCVYLTTIYGQYGERKAKENVFIEDFINVRWIIEREYSEYEKVLCERITSRYFLDNLLPLRKTDSFFEIHKDRKRYVLKYEYTKGRRKLIIIFNTLNGSKIDCEYGLFNNIQMTDYNFKDYAVLNCYESLSGYDGFYTYVFGVSLINEITKVLKSFCESEGYTKENVYILSSGTGAIPGIIYANRLQVKQHISVNPRVNLFAEFSKKKSSSIADVFNEGELKRLNKYFRVLSAMEHNEYYFTNEKELLLNMKNLSEEQVDIIGAQKMKNQLIKLIK